MGVIKMWRAFRKHTHGLEVELEDPATETAPVTGYLCWGSCIYCLLLCLFIISTHSFGSHLTFFNFISSQHGDADLIASPCTLPKAAILVGGFASCTF